MTSMLMLAVTAKPVRAINFVLSSDLRPHVLDTWVKRGAELSTDHHLVVNQLRWWRRMPVRPGRPECIVRIWQSPLSEAA